MTYSNLPLSFRVYESLDFLNYVLCSVALTVEKAEPVCPYGRAGERPLHDALRWDVRCCRILRRSVI